LQLSEGLLHGDFIKPLGLAKFLVAAVLVGLPLAKFLQDADFSVSLNQRLAATLDLRRHRLPLLGNVALLSPSDKLVTLRLDKAVDINGPRGCIAPAKLPQGIEFRCQVVELLTEHFVNTIGFGQGGAAFVAP
jgi:hypothetical protein